jgi:hypothetical protein
MVVNGLRPYLPNRRSSEAASTLRLQSDRSLFSLIDGPPLGSSLLVATRNEISAGGPFPILRGAPGKRYGRPRGGTREPFL